MPHFCHRFWEKVPLFIMTFNFVVHSHYGQGGHLLCKALEMNSTVETPKPICSTRIDRNGGKLQMSCQWTQLNEGDRAYFKGASSILSEHHISELNFTDTLNMTHQFSINVGLDQMSDEVVIKCIVSRHGKGRGREMCEFPLIKNYTRGKKDFKCCVPNPSKPVPLLYDGDFKELLFDSSRNCSAVDDDCLLLFLCGAMEYRSKITILDMESLDLRKQSQYGKSKWVVNVLNEKHSNKSSNGDEQCTMITVNLTNLHLTSVILDSNSKESLIPQNGVSPEATETVSSIPSTDGTVIHQRILLALAIVAIVASALAFFTGVCITKYYYRYMYNISGKHFYLVRRDRVQDPARGSTSTADDGAGALAMTIFTPETRAETPQQNGDSTTVFIQHPLDEERHCLKNETTGSCSGPPTLPLRREMEKDDTGGRPGGVESSNGQQNAPIASGDTSVTDGTYCSVDDVKVMRSTAKNHKLYCKSQLCPSSGPPEAIRDDVKDTTSPTPELDDLYAKPDMSQKAKNKAPVESDYDYPRPPGDDFFRSILVQENGLSLPIRTADQAGDAYGNVGASLTDESINGDELYISTPGPALI